MVAESFFASDEVEGIRGAQDDEAGVGDVHSGRDLFLDPFLTCHHPDIATIAGKLATAIASVSPPRQRARRPRDAENHSALVAAIAANIALAVVMGHSPPLVAVSLRKPERKRSRYEPSGLRQLSTVAPLLAKAGIVELSKSKKRGKASIIEPVPDAVSAVKVTRGSAVARGVTPCGSAQPRPLAEGLEDRLFLRHVLADDLPDLGLCKFRLGVSASDRQLRADVDPKVEIFAPLLHERDRFRCARRHHDEASAGLDDATLDVRRLAPVRSPCVEPREVGAFELLRHFRGEGKSVTDGAIPSGLCRRTGMSDAREECQCGARDAGGKGDLADYGGQVGDDGRRGMNRHCHVCSP